MTENKNADRPTILVTEDNAILRFLAAETLTDHGYKVLEAESAEEALKVLETHKDVRLLFTDIQMPPGLDGLELAREVHSRWPKVLLVVTSGQVRPLKEEIADDGRFLAKPYQAKDLLVQIDEMIEHQNK
jgi:CheY-like chemotaxis protein